MARGFEQPTTESEAVTAGAIGEETVVADAMEALDRLVELALRSQCIAKVRMGLSEVCMPSRFIWLQQGSHGLR